MKTLFAASILIWTFCAVSIAQTNQSLKCPAISVTGPATIVTTGASGTFTANVTDGDSLKYIWTVSRGTIIEGQNSPVIKVATTPDDANSEIIATVEIKGLPENCAKTASETAKVESICRLPIDLDDYEKIPFRDEKARLGNVARNLTERPETSVLFVVYFPKKENPQSVKKYIERISNTLTQIYKIPRDKFVFVNGEAEKQRTRILIVPNDVFETVNKSVEESVKEN